MILAADTGTIYFLSDTYEGSMHDKAIVDETTYPLPVGSALLQDLGFQGMALHGVHIIQPYKSNQDLPYPTSKRRLIVSFPIVVFGLSILSRVSSAVVP